MTQQPEAQPLSDLRVIDLTHGIAGPYCTKLLADFGADVIKVERPGSGDYARHEGPFPQDVPHPEKSGLFLHLNTNKRSITLDLKTAQGAAVVKELVKNADALVENFRPGVMASLGLDYDTLSKINPNLIMTSISNFGQTGPYRDYIASELDPVRNGRPDERLRLPGQVPAQAGGQPRAVPGREQRRNGHAVRPARQEPPGHGRAVHRRFNLRNADGLHQRADGWAAPVPVQRRHWRAAGRRPHRLSGGHLPVRRRLRERHRGRDVLAANRCNAGNAGA